MATKIVTKNSSTASAVPTASDLVQGELAVNVADKRLFTEDNGGAIVELGTNPSTIDINAGTIDGTAIGASSASTGAFTTLTATGAFTSLGIDDNADATAITIDSSENVGIGVTNPSDYYASWNNLVVGDTSGSAGMSIVTGTSNEGTIAFADGTSGDAQYKGYIQYNQGVDRLVIGVNGTEKMRIDSSGNLLVGTTDTSLYNNTSGGGFHVAPNGFTEVAYQSATAADPSFIVNNTGVDGDIIQLRKDGTVVGTIGTVSGDIRIGGLDDNHASLRFAASSKAVLPVKNSDGGLSDNTTDLGASNARFKDLYLSGNAYLGDGKDLSWGGTYNDGNPTIAASSNFIAFYPEGTTSGEAARIDSSGNLLVGCTALPSGGAGGAGFETGQSGGRTILQLGTTVTSTEAVARFYNPNGAIGNITLTGSTCQFNSPSDQRLKENIADADDAGGKIDAIQVRQYDWKVDGSHQDYGMIAQELVEVAPEAVSGDADSEEMMGVDYSKLVPMLIKEIQSLRNRVAQLEE